MTNWKTYEVSAKVIRINSTLYIHIDKEFCKRHDVLEGDVLDLIAHGKRRNNTYYDLVFIPKILEKN